MKKASYKKPPRRKFKPLIIVVILIIAAAIGVSISIQYILGSDIFKVKKITYPKAIEIPRDSSVFDLLGKNLFYLNLKEITKKIKAESPALGQIKISRRLPDELIIAAEKRAPVAIVKLSDKNFYVDSESVIISSAGNPQNSLPVIFGVVNRPQNFGVGQVYDDKNLEFALEIIREIGKISYLNKLVAAKVNVSSLSHASFIFANGIEVVVGEERLAEKLQLLVLVLSRLDKELNQIKYVDLRFKEPAIGRK